VCCSYKGERNKESLLAQAKGIFAFPTASMKFKVFFAYFFLWQLPQGSSSLT
jgi:hypothetical protein